MDIVKWLRELRLSTSNADWNAIIVNNRLDEAADEIELLRRQFELSRDFGMQWMDELDQLRKELAEAKLCSCRKREQEIEQLFEELSQ